MSSKPPDYCFFVDRSLGKHKIPDAIRATGRAVRVHDDEFPPATKDEVWLTRVGEAGWLVLTKDEHIRYREIERAAVEETGVKLFVLTSGNLTGDEMAKIIVAALPRIERLASKNSGAILARIDRGGRVTVMDKG